MKRKKKSHRAIYGLMGAVVAATTIGTVAAKETKPYKAPELRLVQGSVDYDLTEGITYDNKKYELMVEDTGDFDIEVLGRYDVEYSLTPLDEEEENTSVSDNTGISKNDDPDFDSAFTVESEKTETASSHTNKEETLADTEQETEKNAEMELESNQSEAKAEPKKGNFFTRLLGHLTGHVYAAEVEETGAETLEKNGFSTRPVEIDLPETTKTKSETETERESDTEHPEPDRTQLDDKKELDDIKESESAVANETPEANPEQNASGGNDTGTEASGKTETGKYESETGAENTDVSRATPSDAEGGTLDDIDGIIYFSRVVRVVASDYSNIEFDDPHLEIPSGADLYGIQIQGRIPVASDSNAEPNEDGDNATPSNAEKADVSDDSFWTYAEEDSAEAIEDSDGVTGEGVEYKLFLKNPDLILGDAFFTDADGKKVKKVKVTVKNDEELKSAVIVESNEQGAPVITGMELGTYTVALTAVDPETEKEIVCEREVRVVPDERVIFDAPVLYIGTKNTSYELTSGMLARDENGGPVEPIYVLNEEELLAAKEEVQVKATPSNAEGSIEETETEETVTEVRLKKGTYHVTLGAKHPVSGDEFTVEREVQVVDGYYIYAPVLEIAAGSTDYNLLQGVEVKNDEGTTANVEVKLKDASELLRAAEEFETMSAESTEEENDFAADTAEMYSENSADERALSGNPALKEGSYSITLMANDPDTGEEIITKRTILARASANMHDLTAYYRKEKYITSGGYPSWRANHYVPYGIYVPTYSEGRYENVYEDSYKGYYITAWSHQTSLPLNAGGSRIYWKNNMSTPVDNPGSWSTFGTGAGIKGSNDDPDVLLMSGRSLDVSFFEQFSLLNYWFKDWDASKSLVVEGEKLIYSNNNHKLLGGVYKPIGIPKGQFGIHSFLLSSNADTPDTPYQDLYIKLLDNESYLSLENIQVAKHQYWQGLGNYHNGDYRMRNGTIIIVGEGKGSVEIRTAYTNASDRCPPNYIVDAVNEVYMKSQGSGTQKPQCAITSSGNTSIEGGFPFQHIQLKKGSTLTLVGTGYMSFHKTASTSAVPYYTNLTGTITAGTIRLEPVEVVEENESGNKSKKLISDNLIYKEPTLVGKDNPVIKLESNVESNGYVIKGARQDSKVFGSGETYASTTTTEKYGLDATDFYVANPDEKKTQSHIYFTSTQNGKKIVTTYLDTAPIHVQNSDQTYKEDFETYTEALNKIENITGKKDTYTITNLVEREFTDKDAETLQKFSNGDANLIFSSGTRNDTIDGGRYRVRVRKQVLQLPANMSVTFKNIVLKYAQGIQSEVDKSHKDQNLYFVKNGGSLTFGENVSFLAGDKDETGYAYVFGGCTDKDCSDDVNITINSGTFTSVYGGGHGTGRHSGEATITINGTVKIRDTLSGGNITNYERNKGTKKSIITINSQLEVPNIYDYDELTIGASVTVSQNLNSERTPNYGGVTILNGGSELILSGDKTGYTRQMGRLKLADGATQNAKLSFARKPSNLADGPSVIADGNPVVLTKEDPLYMKDTNANKTNRIEVGYSSKNPAVGDIVFHLPGVTAGNELTEVSTGHLEDCFEDATHGMHKDSKGNFIVMIAKPADKTIVLVDKSVGLSIKQGDDTYSKPTTYITLEEALTDLISKENENGPQRGSYRINFFADRYSISDADKLKMKEIPTSVTEILWTSKVDANGNYLQDSAEAKIVSPEGDLTFYGTRSIVQDMTMEFNGKYSIYANGFPLEISTGVKVLAGAPENKPDLYGGSNTQEVADTNLHVLSGEFANIYAGGDGQNVIGNTSLIMEGGLATSVYGGGNGGTVGGNSTVSMEVPNKAGSTEFTFTDISGQGTLKGGTLTDSVTGTKMVSVVPTDKNTDLKVHVNNLTGFDQLTLGDATGKIDYANQQFHIKNRFDSSLTDGGTSRKDTVNLNRSSLVLECGSGHIGNLNSQKVSALVIKREGNVTSPLLIDGKVTVSSTETTAPDGVTKSTVYDKIRLMYVDQNDSAEEDVMVTYSKTVNTTATEAIFYEDGTNGGLPTLKKDRAGGTSDIIFSKKKAHTMEGEVIYPDDSRIEDASKQSENISKYIVVNYDQGNNHAVAGGYVVKIPKDKITDQTYTENWMKQDGTYEQKLTEGSEMFKLKFETTGTGNGAKGITAVAVPIDTENFFYVAHVICTNADKSSLLLDVTAPRQSRTSGDAVVNYEGDGVNGTYHIHGDSRDYNITDKTLLPDAPSSFQSLGTKLAYTPHGVKLAAWSFGDVNGNETAEKALAKADFGVDINAVPAGLHLINITPAANEAVCDINFDIPQTDVKTAIAAGQEYLVVYVKDTVNNTAKYIIPLSDSMIDVKVPTKVSLVAIKKSGTGLGVDACKLLAPTCYIVNYGSNQVKAEVAKFEADTTSQLLQLVKGNKTTSYNANQIALHLKSTGSGLASNAADTDENTRFDLRNVLDIEDQTGKRAFLGNLAPKSEGGRTLDFTFGAYYDPANIQETEDWLTNTMSYHFSVVKTLPPTP